MKEWMDGVDDYDPKSDRESAEEDQADDAASSSDSPAPSSRKARPSDTYAA